MGMYGGTGLELCSGAAYSRCAGNCVAEAVDSVGVVTGYVGSMTVAMFSMPSGTCALQRKDIQI